MILKNRSLIFAPMDGITDPLYRAVINTVCPEWDFQFTDFLRLPSVSTLKQKNVIDFVGVDFDAKKNPLQILTNKLAAKPDSFKAIDDTEVLWLDLNFGCPANKVCSHHGGASLLDRQDDLRLIVQIAKKNFSKFLSAKIRLGVNDDKNFLENLKILEGEGVDAITIHPRTRAQMYGGRSSWEHIALAVSRLKIPVIGNGDVVTVADYERMLSETGCHSVMIGRGALANPWLADEIKHKHIGQEFLVKQKKERILKLLFEIEKREVNKQKILIRLKQLTRYLYQNIESETFIVELLRSSACDEYMKNIHQRAP